jgi:hypothetical protein
MLRARGMRAIAVLCRNASNEAIATDVALQLKGPERDALRGNVQ